MSERFINQIFYIINHEKIKQKMEKKRADALEMAA